MGTALEASRAVMRLESTLPEISYSSLNSSSSREATLQDLDLLQSILSATELTSLGSRAQSIYVHHVMIILLRRAAFLAGYVFFCGSEF